MKSREIGHKPNNPTNDICQLLQYNVEPFLKLLTGQKLGIWVLNKIKCTARPIEIVRRGGPPL